MLKTLIWLRGIHILVDGILLLGAFILAYFTRLKEMATEIKDL
jgi:hypothetical protein